MTTALLPRPAADPLGQLLTLEWLQEPGEHPKERRVLIDAIAECPKCGELVELVAETTAWVQERDADGRYRWRHEDYGPTTGICCDLLLHADNWDGVVHAWKLA